MDSLKVSQWKPFIDFCKADPSQLTVLKLLIDFCKEDPSNLSDPLLSFFRDYLESLGAKIPASAYQHGETKQVKYEKAKKQEQSSSSVPWGGMPGIQGSGFQQADYEEAKKKVCAQLGWMPRDADLIQVLNDPELVAAFSDPEIMASLQNVSDSLVATMSGRTQSNPKVASVIAKMMSK